MEAGEAHLGLLGSRASHISDAYAHHLDAAERGLSGTLRELLQCLGGFWCIFYLPHLSPTLTLPSFQLWVPSAGWSLPRGSSETRGAPGCTWLSKSPSLAVAAVTFNAPQPGSTFEIQSSTRMEQWAYTAMSRDRW